MRPPEALAARVRGEARVLACLLRGLPARGDHAERVDAFYRGQAEHYDRFRERLLHGRRDLIEALAPQPGERVAELGAGTGRNLEFLGTRLAGLARLDLVDLSPSLLAFAQRRAAGHANVRVIQCDVTEYRPEAPLDAAWLSYSLTMMPRWRAALEHALGLLRPGGRLGVVDFTVGPAQAAPGRRRQGRLAQRLWKLWFGHDGVRLDAAHLQWLEARTRCVLLAEHDAPLPWLPGLRAPYYLYVGCKP